MIKPKLNAEGQNKHSTILPREYYRINNKYIKWDHPESFIPATDIYVDIPEEFAPAKLKTILEKMLTKLV